MRIFYILQRASSSILVERDMTASLIFQIGEAYTHVCSQQQRRSCLTSRLSTSHRPHFRPCSKHQQFSNAPLIFHSNRYRTVVVFIAPVKYSPRRMAHFSDITRVLSQSIVDLAYQLVDYSIPSLPFGVCIWAFDIDPVAAYASIGFHSFAIRVSEVCSRDL